MPKFPPQVYFSHELGTALCVVTGPGAEVTVYPSYIPLPCVPAVAQLLVGPVGGGPRESVVSIWGHPAAMERLRALSGEGQREGGWGLKQDPSQQAARGCVSCGDFSPSWPRSSSLPAPAPCGQQHRCHLLRSFLPSRCGLLAQT